MTDKPEKTAPQAQQRAADAMMAPGDEAAPGTPGTGEDICPKCGGSGSTDGKDCEFCLGRGRIIRAISAGP